MKVEKFVPREILRPFIEHFLIIESEEGMQNRILPSSSLVLSFRIQGTITSQDEKSKTRLPYSAITGLRKIFRVLEYSPKTSTVLAIFKEAGASNFIKEPLHRIFGSTISLDDLISPRIIREIEEKLSDMKTNSQRIALIENFLISEWKDSQPDLLILDSIQKIHKSKGSIKIQDLIKGVPYSMDSFEKKFRSQIGTTPKQFSNMIRMKNLIDDHSEDKTLTESAYSAGYFDQAHFIKDFKTFTGETPKQFFKRILPFW
ncbi:helix-turn-helix domain-containing protein [Leptospira sarikeiensis]|uniref:AraC family transcriptional regulator n=1 Tax=Leptospira sarikeiensis TaxID=2484943 RepID=A0A4R9K3M7_9LEPT|nr:helix-turn-helix domain-containing protein [Leptospira sarikeiensis]TGL59494.1 AraC family transcriptional regulator [Leptospira sarikeiensis]